MLTTAVLLMVSNAAKISTNALSLDWSQCYAESCYHKAHSPMSWTEAGKFCVDLGAELASVHSREENTFLYYLCGSNDSCWLGFSDAEVEGVWEWRDGSNVQYLNWGDNETNDVSNHDYASIGGPFGRWTDMSDEQANTYAICEKNGTVPFFNSSPCYGNLCYYQTPSQMTWEEANSTCFSLGAELASVHSLEKNTHLYIICGSENNCWVGFNDVAVEGEWEWSDGSNVEFTNWEDGEPNNKNNADYAVIVGETSLWNDMGGSYDAYAICQKSDTIPAIVWSECYGTSCYYKTPSKMLWTEANMTCVGLGVELASIHSLLESTFLFNLCGDDNDCWIGLTDEQVEGNWEWTDGSSFDYENWASGQPDNHWGQHYVALLKNKNGRWYDSSESFQAYAICMKSAATSTETPSRIFTGQPTVVPSSDATTTPTSEPTNYPTKLPTAMPTLSPSASTKPPTHNPTPTPSVSPTKNPTIDPSNFPTLYPTNWPTPVCVIIEEWTQAQADELCREQVHHAYGVGLCEKYDHPDYQRRLEFALANQLYSSCDHKCLYDYDTYNTSKPHAFRWTGSCYNVATGYFCIDERDEMEQSHAQAATLCETTDECVERIEWTEEVAESNCPDGYSNGDKGWGTAKVCPDLVRQRNGFYERADVLYGASFNRSLANRMFLSCSAKCLYDIENEGVVYQWKKDCWVMQTDWACIRNHVSEYEWAMMYLRESICAIPTPAPVIVPCVEREQDWTVEIADQICPADAMGVTKKGVDAIVCTGYDDFQYRLDHSLANRAFLTCDSWCVYDIYKKGYEAFIWKSAGTCYIPVSKGLCIWTKSHHREQMTDYIENILCESTTPEPTEAPTYHCLPLYTWDEDRAEELCPSLEDLVPDRSFGAAVCDDDTSLTKQANLEKSLANDFSIQCSSWCVYDYDTIMNNIKNDSAEYGGFIWKNTCWKWVTDWACFTSHLYEFDAVSLRALDQCEVHS